MTRQEAREAIKEAYGNSEYTDEIIKALEQEPILDKIRVEIENITPKAKFQTGKTSIDVQMMIPQEKVLQIIDKYKAESEDK